MPRTGYQGENLGSKSNETYRAKRTYKPPYICAALINAFTL